LACIAFEENRFARQIIFTYFSIIDELEFIFFKNTPFGSYPDLAGKTIGACGWVLVCRHFSDSNSHRDFILINALPLRIHSIDSNG
jgi:hypothetical protein